MSREIIERSNKIIKLKTEATHLQYIVLFYILYRQTNYLLELLQPLKQDADFRLSTYTQKCCC
jgi:hypothetical protein